MKLPKLDKPSLKEINNILVPLMIEHLFLASIGLLISFFLKKTGAQAVASVGMMNNVNLLINNVFTSIGVGVSVTVAQYCGRNDKKSTGIVALQGIKMSFLISLVMLAVLWLLKDQILVLLLKDSEPLVYSYSHSYFDYYMLSMPFIAIYTVASAALRGSGYPVMSLVAVFVYNGIYATLSGISTLVFNMGLEGVCRSQLLGAVIASIVAVILVRKGNDNMKIEKYTFGFNHEIIKPMLRVGVPVLIENVFFSLGRLITQTFAVPYGTDYIAANGIVNNINNIMSVPVIAAISAAPPLIGKYCGKGDKENAMLKGKQLTLWVIIIEMSVAAVALVVINPLAKAMSNSELIQTLIKQVIYLKIITLPIGYSLSFVLPAVMRSSGDVKYIMVVNTLTMFIGRLGIAYLLTYVIKLGILGIWIGQYSDWFFRILFFVPRFRKGKWLEYSIFDD